MLTLCCIKLCTSIDCLAHNPLRFFCVWRVSNQIKSPRTRVKKEHKTTSHPWILSQPLFIGRARAGSDAKNVTNTTMALTTPARVMWIAVIWYSLSYIPVSGHWVRSRLEATLLRVKTSLSCCSLMRENASNRPPHPRKKKLTKR